LKYHDQRFQEKRKIVMEVERIISNVEIPLDVLVKKKKSLIKNSEKRLSTCGEDIFCRLRFKTENYVEEFYVLSTLRRLIKMQNASLTRGYLKFKS
jgi:hypothetical protein